MWKNALGLCNATEIRPCRNISLKGIIHKKRQLKIENNKEIRTEKYFSIHENTKVFQRI